MNKNELLKSFVYENKFIIDEQNNSILFNKIDYNRDELQKFIIMNTEPDESLPNIIEEDVGNNLIKVSLDFDI